MLLSSLLSTSEHTIWMDIFHRSSSPGLQPPCASLVCYPILKSNKRHSDSNSILCSVSKKGGGDSEKSLRHQIASSSSSVTTQDCMSLFPVVVITAFNWQTPFLFANWNWMAFRSSISNTRDLPGKCSGDIFYRWIFRQVATHKCFQMKVTWKL